MGLILALFILEVKSFRVPDMTPLMFYTELGVLSSVKHEGGGSV